MKIRIKGNYLRFRLRQDDVAALTNNGSIVERIEFGETTDQQISFALESCGEEKMTIAYNNNKVRVLVPKQFIERWINTEQVGIAVELITGRNRTVSVLIEKDFACLDASEEDNVGTYSHPLSD